MSYANEKRVTNLSNEEMVRSISQNIVNLGYGRLMTEEEKRASEEKRRKSAKRYAFRNNVFGCVRSIVYTPLSIAFHAVSFISRAIGCVAAFGMLVGGYHIYVGIREVMGGLSFADVEAFGKAIPFFIAPFVAYGISEVSGRIYRYFEDNAC